MVGLKPISIQDAEWLYQVITNNLDSLKDYFGVTVKQVTCHNSAKNTITQYENWWQNNQFRVYVIKKELTSVGLLYIKHIDTRHQKCELAYFIDKQYQGQGIATTAIKKGIAIAFDELKLNKVFCKIDTVNTASCRVAEKSGMVKEGVLHQEFKMSDGSFVDVAYYGIVKG